MIIKLLLTFISGLLIGYILELAYRSLRYGKLIKPRFVNYQMYGLSAVFLYFLYYFDLPTVFKILLIFLGTTAIEFITGYGYLKIKKVRLWDYSKYAFNYQGIICLRFSLYWLTVSLFYYYVILRVIMGV